VGFKNVEELSEPCGMRRPCGTCNKFAVCNGFVDLKRDEGSSGQFDLGGAGRICTQAFSGKDPSGGEKLRAVAERCDGLVGAVEVTNDLEYARIEAEIFGCSATGYDKRVIVFGLDVVEGGVENEVVAGLFGIGLIAFEVVNGGANTVAGSFVGTDRVYGVADHLKGLKGNHDLIVFNEVSDEHEKFCRLEGRAMGGGHRSSFRKRHQ
jgi:hypothetical protein